MSVSYLALLVYLLLKEGTMSASSSYLLDGSLLMWCFFLFLFSDYRWPTKRLNHCTDETWSTKLLGQLKFSRPNWIHEQDSGTKYVYGPLKNFIADSYKPHQSLIGAFLTFLQKLMDVLDFLRLPKRKLSSQHVKIHTRPLARQVENWDDVYNALKGTEFERCLRADYQV